MLHSMDIESVSKDAEVSFKRRKADETEKRQDEKKNLSVQEILLNIKKLRLEAIFHPKFDNERAQGEIRQTMISKVASGMGLLEVTLKHSGSLLLWSGGQRYYSKNSTNNIFTMTGEILLRQHFARAWWESHENDSTGDLSMTDPQRVLPYLQNKYHECSDYVMANRLTLAFELVTSILGDHGDIPMKDYLILTAVARLDSGTFFTTSELMAFARRFRLPNNDSWLFRTKDSVASLLHLYDSCKEIGLADLITSSLSSIADGGHHSSMYPHLLFHGNLLEGLVIRYVPRNEITITQSALHDSDDNLTTLDSNWTYLVPFNRPPVYELVKDLEEPVPVLFTTNLRLVTSSVPEDAKQFLNLLEGILEQTDGKASRREVVSTPHHTLGSLMGSTKNLNAEILNSLKLLPHPDDETSKIANVLHKLDRLGIAMESKIYCESSEDAKDRTTKNRYICILHILHDESFKKYSKNMLPGEMNLFRGFSIELCFADDRAGEAYSPMDTTTDSLQFSTNSSWQNAPDHLDSTLMLKMKLLPYMVRTFICRNGLPLLKRSGSKGFDQQCLKLMNKWGISQNSISFWFPFLSSWGKYAYLLLSGSQISLLENLEGIQRLPPLTQSSYLNHLHYFSDLYYKGTLAKMKILKDKRSDFMGLVVLVGVHLDEMRALALSISSELDYLEAWTSTGYISEENIYDAGFIVGTSLDNGPGVTVKIARDLALKGHDVFLVLVGCTVMELTAMELDKMNDGSINAKKISGLAASWRKCNCKQLIEIPREMLFTNNSGDLVSSFEIDRGRSCEQLDRLYQTLEKSKKSSVCNRKIGTVIFFPTIPGSGKSALSACFQPIVNGSESCKKLKERDVIVKESDSTKGKYYPLVTREKCMNPSSIYIADKNVPPNSWESIEALCVRSRSMAIPVLPAYPALQTTVIHNTTPTGSSIALKFPFSLEYLAVCMARVLKRPRSSHAGKLDISTQNASMIVVKFYCFYSNMTAESFIELMRDKIGDEVMASPIHIPFFISESLPVLPSELDALLREAISMQMKVDCEKPKKEEQVILSDMDSKLREVINRHSDFLERLTVPLSVSQASALNQISETMDYLDSMSTTEILGANIPSKLLPTSSSFSRYCAIDLDIHQVQKVLDIMSRENDGFRTCLEDICQDRSQLVRNVHVTLAHTSQMSQLGMKTRFGSVVGRKIVVHIHGILFSSGIAALKVTFEPTCVELPPIPVPEPFNSFVHATVWCRSGVSPVEANNLPLMCSCGQAYDYTIAEGPVNILGTIAYSKY